MIIVDVEIKKAILGRDEEPIPDIEYCEGWRDFANMGLTCVCTYDIVSGLPRAFTVGSRQNNLADLAEYLKGKATAGFNTRRFDNRLLNEHGIIVDVESHYDMLEAIWVALGLNPDKFYYKTHDGWGLDSVCQATLGIAKTGNGALAPVWWQQGYHGKVIDYCLNDVWMEGQLLKHILQGRPVRNLAGHVVRVEPPQQWAVRPASEVILAVDPATEPPSKTAFRSSSGGLGIIR